ncbi:MAG: DUF104 domain-containing protein [Phycisphaerae bacterium]
MVRKLRATYRQRKFHPDSACDLPEGAVVELEVRGPLVGPPGESDEARRSQIREALVARLRNARLDANAPRLSRDDLHDRR